VKGDKIDIERTLCGRPDLEMGPLRETTRESKADLVGETKKILRLVWFYLGRAEK
jgi:hypothetical protein